MIPEACHEISSSIRYIFVPTLLGWLILASAASAQQQTVTGPPQEDATKIITPAWPSIKDAKTIVPGDWYLTAGDQESDGPVKKLHGHAQVQSASLLVRADEIEYNEETKDIVAKGFKSGDVIREMAKEVGGTGGGKPDMAQAGGADPAKISAAFDKLYELVGRA